MVNKITTPPTTSELIGTVNEIIDGKQDVISDLATIRSGAALGATAVQPSDLATVATSGSYNDLSNKPTIPAAQVNSDWNATSGVAQILNKPTIPTVPTNVSAFTNDAGYITNVALTGYATENYVDTGLATKQATLVSGTNIKTINNQSLLGSGNIDIQGGSSYTAGTGIDITNDVISVTNAISTGAALGATAVQPSDLATVATSGSYSDLTNIPTNLLKNTATASSALTISGIATDKTGAINIGTSSQATGRYGVSIGSFSYANGSTALGLGYSARATSNYAIQLGQGTNSTASTLYVGFNNSNYLLLDGTTGLIPDARLSSNILRSADLSGYATENWVNNQGYLTGITSSDVTSALGYTPYNATNPNGYITSSALSGYALDADVMHLSGAENITGEKTFTNKMLIQSTTDTSSSAYVDFIQNINNARRGTMRTKYNSDGSYEVIFGCNGPDASAPQGLSVKRTSSNITVSAPASDVNGSIVTTVNKSKAANGYFQLGNGMIVNWGYVNSWTSNAAQVTFPKAFTTTRQVAIARSAGATTTNDGGDYYVRGISNTGFDIYRTSTNTGGVSWIAIGY